MITTNTLSDEYGPSMLPLMTEIIFSEMERFPDAVPFLLKVKTGVGSGYQTTEQTGIGKSSEIPQGSSVNYQDITQGNSLTVVFLKYGAGIKVTEETIDDQKFDQLSDAYASMPRSMLDLKQELAMNNLNNGFTVNGYDGVPFFSTAHPLPSGGTQANRPSVGTDLSVTALEEMLTLIGNWKDISGLRYNANVDYLVTGLAPSYAAYQLIGSDYQPNVANNAINAFQMYSMKPFKTPYITDTNAWFLRCSSHHLCWWDRKSPVMETFPDFDIGAIKTKITARWETKHASPWGWAGSPGGA